MRLARGLHLDPLCTEVLSDRNVPDVVRSRAYSRVVAAFSAASAAVERQPLVA